MWLLFLFQLVVLGPDDDYHISSSSTIKLESSCQTFPDDFNVLERYRVVGSAAGDHCQNNGDY